MSPTNKEHIDRNPNVFGSNEQQTQEEKIQELKKENENMLAFLQKKEKAAIGKESRDAIAKLKEAIQAWEQVLDAAAISYLEDQNITPDELQKLQESAQKVIEQLEHIEEINAMADYVPAALQISSEEYKSALHDVDQRKQTLQKLDTALTHIARSISGSQWGSSELFNSAFMFLDTALVLIQETHIDMNTTLQKIDA